MEEELSSFLLPLSFDLPDPRPDIPLFFLQTLTDIPQTETPAPTLPPTTTPLVIATTMTLGHNITILEVGGEWLRLEGMVPGQWCWQTIRRPGVNCGLSQCPQGGLDPDNGTELGTLENELAGEDKEGGGPTMGPDFRAAEQSSLAQFQMFSVSLGVWVRCKGRDSCVESHKATFSILPSFYCA